MHRLTLIVALGALGASAAHADDSSSGIDAALFRPSYDTNGILGVEGARLMPKRDLSLKLANTSCEWRRGKSGLLFLPVFNVARR